MRALAWLALLLALGCSRAPEPGRLEGEVAWQGRGIGSALVEAYLRPERDPTVPPAGEAGSTEDGAFSLTLPPGRYWVWARATLAGETRLVGQAAGNPVTIAAGKAARVRIELTDPSGFAASAGPAGTGAAGMVQGAPPAEVTVYAYPGRHPRPVGPGFVAAATPDPSGAFLLDLPPGAYTLAARWRTSGQNFGSLEPGDRVAVAALAVAAGGYADAGVLTLRPLDPAVWREVSGRPSPGTAAVGGRVVDPAGAPVPGVRVLAFTDPRMAGKPAALSGPTGADGRFDLPLPGAGTYFLGARSRLGGPAAPGEKVGAFRGNDGAGLRVAESRSPPEVTLVVEEVW